MDIVAGIDKSKMNIYELCNYAELLKKADELFKPSYAETLAGIGISHFGGYCTAKEES